MNYVNEQNMQEILDGIARKIGQGGGSGAGLEDWQASHEYTEKDICVYEGQIYRAKVGYTSDTTFSTTQILEEYTPIGGETIIPYVKDTAITTGDIVSYDGNDYEALYNFVCGEEFSLYALEEYVPIELTDDDIKEIVGAYNPVFEEAKGIEYSTEERRIGTWIDGKPLYQKSFTGTTTSNADSTEPLISFTESIDIVVSLKGIIKRTLDNIVTALDFNYYNTSTDYASLIFRIGTGFRHKVCADNINSPCYITIQYTKTTD